jgi:hypothetical protein
MAIANDNSLWENAGSVSSGSFSYTNTAGNFMVAFPAFFQTSNASDKITGCTYNGVSMTQIPGIKQTISASGGEFITMYGFYLANPATGANTFVCSASATADLMTINVQTYTGANGGLDASNSAQGTASSSSFSASITTLATGAWVTYGGYNTSGVNSFSPGVVRGSSGHETGGGDSNGTVTAGSNSISMGVGGNVASALLLISISPTAAVVNKSNFLAFM